MYREYSQRDLREIAEAMERASQSFLRVADLMHESGMGSVFLQIPISRTHTLDKMSADTQFQFCDQLKARDSGNDPAFIAVRKKNAVDAQKRAAKSDGQAKVPARKKK